jgi:hypothetical protein
VRRAIIHAALLAAVVLFSPTDGAAQQSPAMIAAAAKAPNTGSWTARAQRIPQIPTRPGVMFPTIEAHGQAPSTVGEEMPGVAEVKTEDDRDVRAATDENAFLLPVWHYGFWAMPPGGLTRFLWQPQDPINPESTLAADPVIVNSDCPSLP